MAKTSDLSVQCLSLHWNGMSSSLTTSSSFVQTILFVCLFVCLCFLLGEGDFLHKMGSCNFLGKLLPTEFLLKAIT